VYLHNRAGKCLWENPYGKRERILVFHKDFIFCDLAVDAVMGSCIMAKVEL